MQLKPVIAFFACFIAATTSAQFQKGMKMPGVSLAGATFSSGTSDFSGTNQMSSSSTTNTVGFSITPSMGWFLNDRTVAGVSLLINSSSTKSRRGSAGITNQKDNFKNMDYGAGVFLRYYFKTFHSVIPFLHGYINAGSGSSSSDGVYYSTASKSNYEGKSSGRFFTNAGINAGITKMLNSNVGLDVFAGYGLASSKITFKSTQVIDYTDPTVPDTNSEYETTQKFTNNALNIGIGFQFFLNKSK